MRFLRLVVVMAGAASLPVACGAHDTRKLAIEGDWALESRASAGQAVPVLPDTTITATFSDGKLTGSSGCNRYSGTYRVSGNKITLGPLAVTGRACLESAFMEQESAYLAALQSVSTFSLVEKRLELRDSFPQVVLTFRPGK